jgi:hypothetical protein
MQPFRDGAAEQACPQKRNSRHDRLFFIRA